MEHIQIALEKARQRQDLARPPVTARHREPDAESPWASLPLRRPDPTILARNRIVTTSATGPSHVAFGMLRTRILQMMHQNGWTSIAVTSPMPACGKTLVSLNLAFSFANQTDCRTLLLDMDLNRTRMKELLGWKDVTSISQLLQGSSPAEKVLARCRDNLAVATNAQPVRFTSELLQHARTGEILRDLRHRLRPDVTIYDMPPMLSSADFMAFLPNVDCAILVVAAEVTKRSEIDLCEQELAEKTNLLGVVLNKCRYTPEDHGY